MIYIPLDCEGPYGCPYEEWIKYLAAKEGEVVQVEGIPHDVDTEGYPTDGIAKLVKIGDLYFAAVWDSRFQLWVSPDLERTIMRSDVKYYYDMPVSGLAPKPLPAHSD